jgi:hypothetical protein
MRMIGLYPLGRSIRMPFFKEARVQRPKCSANSLRFECPTTHRIPEWPCNRLVWSEVPREALLLAGKAFMSYRKAGGTRTSPLLDFFIRAHAAVSDLILITRDAERVRTHFPKLRVLSPQVK